MNDPSKMRHRRLSCLPQGIGHPAGTPAGTSFLEAKAKFRKSITRSHSSCFNNLEGLHRIVEVEQIEESHSKINPSSSLRSDSSLED
mmetsp:Transcript_24067/g.37010  ORF Transcript_24067/g.37010 Transcript_24067/m.37010 type:complete len:87 (+) Transcript_24067:2359-2619(+)